MTVAAFRFDPPEVAPTPALRWVLARAYAARDTALAETEGDAAAELALRFGLAARIAARQSPEQLVGELGAEAATKIRRQRSLATAQELRLLETLAAVDAVCRALAPTSRRTGAWGRASHPGPGIGRSGLTLAIL